MILGLEPAIILLDSGPLGFITHPKSSDEAAACQAWHRLLQQSGHFVLIPEIIDYEYRRELLLRGDAATSQIQAPDRFKSSGYYLPFTTAAMLQAAQFWADVRRAGRSTADRHALDVEAILAAQAVTLDAMAWEAPDATVVIATTNVGNLGRFTIAHAWQDIQT